jgi:hypothetical protein
MGWDNFFKLSIQIAIGIALGGAVANMLARIWHVIAG